MACIGCNCGLTRCDEGQRAAKLEARRRGDASSGGDGDRLRGDITQRQARRERRSPHTVTSRLKFSQALVALLLSLCLPLSPHMFKRHLTASARQSTTALISHRSPSAIRPTAVAAALLASRRTFQAPTSRLFHQTASTNMPVDSSSASSKDPYVGGSELIALMAVCTFTIPGTLIWCSC